MAGSQWRLFASLLRPHGRQLGLYGGVVAVATALPLAGSLLLSRFVRLAVDRAPAARLVPLALAYAAVGLASAGVLVLVTWRATVLAWTITNGLRHDLAAYVLHADLSFHRDRTPGELVTRVDADVTSMTELLSAVVSRVLSVAVLGVAALAVLVVVRPVLAPPFAVGLVLTGAAAWSQRNTATVEAAAERAAEADVMSTAEQYLSGAEDVASLGAGAHGVARLAERGAEMVRASRARVRAQMGVQTVVRVSAAFFQVLMIGAGAALAARGRLDVAGVVLGYRFAAVVREPVERLTWRIQDSQGAAGAAQRVLALLADERRVPSGDGVLPAGPLDVRFEGVSLVYDDAEDGEDAAVHPLDLRLPAGRALGLVGRTGSGKTSLARLALRLVAPTTGRVLVGGTDAATVDEEGLRRRVTAVPQDVQLFPGTVRDNVTLFAERDDAEIAAALTDVGLSAWLADLPDGLDTVLAADGRRGDGSRVGLSAGEAQLLAIARALLRRPDVVVLDEATSRVDPVTQAAIGAALGRLVRGRTTLVIAHRLETLDACDDIGVLQDGRLVEHGEREALLADPTSHYARLRALGDPAEELA